MTGQALIVQGDALHLPLPDASVDLIVTSPPYWALRTYSAGPGEIGTEPTPAEYLEALWAATAEMKRVLKPTGSAFVDLGDKYSGNETGGAYSASGSTLNNPANVWKQQTRRTPARTGLRPKSLLLLPERYRIGCVDRLGLIARAVIRWDKANPLPESAGDRVHAQCEDWVHLTRFPKYYSAIDEIRTPHTGHPGHEIKPNVSSNGGRNHRAMARDESLFNPLGKWPGNVWRIPSEPLRLPEHLGVQHYAAFPSEWPRRLVLAFSPPGICLDCGQGRVPVVERGEPQVVTGGYKAVELTASYGYGNHGTGGSTLGYRREATILGYACSCTPYTDHPGSGERQTRDYQPMPDARPQGTYGRKQAGEYQPVGPWREYHLDGWKPPPTRPAIILDPFSGTGTTPMVARALGRIGVGVDLSHAYCRAACWRVRHDGAKAISRTNLERQGVLL